MRKAWYFVLSMRPQQWVPKNVFLFAPVVFSGHIFQWGYLRTTFLAFACFCFISGGIYVINDILDREKDRLHPKKRERPIARGSLEIGSAAAAAAAVLLAANYFAWRLDARFFTICLVYTLLNLLYSLHLKQVVIIDIMIVALGFVLRVMAGAVVNHIWISPWILICTFLLAIFLALIKRRQELIKIGSQGVQAHTRRTLLSYNVGLLDQMISVSTATTLISYIMYVVSPDVQQKFHTQKLFYTVPFVIFGIFRYLYLSYTREEGESASDIIYTDLPFTLNIVLWVALFIYLVKF